MTDKQDIHDELMAQIDRYARRFIVDDFHTIRPIRAGIEASIRTLTDRIAELERMFLAACSDLGAINEALGLDPNDGGSEPIIDAIKELEARLEAVGGVGVGSMVPPVPRLKLTRENIDSAARFAIESDLLPPEEWEAAGLYDFAHAVSGGVSVVDDLATLVRRIAHSLRKAAPGNNLVEHALDYLKRHGLDGLPLRQGDSAAQPAPAVVGPDGYCIPESEQFTFSKSRPFAKAWRPFYLAAPPSHQIAEPATRVMFHEGSPEVKTSNLINCDLPCGTLLYLAQQADAELVNAVNALLHQIDIGDFVDSNGHSAKMLNPVHGLMKLLGATPKEPS